MTTKNTQHTLRGNLPFTFTKSADLPPRVIANASFHRVSRNEAAVTFDVFAELPTAEREQETIREIRRSSNRSKVACVPFASNDIAEIDIDADDEVDVDALAIEMQSEEFDRDILKIFCDENEAGLGKTVLNFLIKIAKDEPLTNRDYSNWQNKIEMLSESGVFDSLRLKFK